MHDATLLVDRPGLMPEIMDARRPHLEERPGDPQGPIWTMCEVEAACGTRFIGAVRLTPPQSGAGAARVTRTTGLLVGHHGMTLDVLRGSERSRTGLAAWEVIPLRLRFLVDPPFAVLGLDPRGQGVPLVRGVWTRPLEPLDLAEDASRLAPFAC